LKRPVPGLLSSSASMYLKVGREGLICHIVMLKRVGGAKLSLFLSPLSPPQKTAFSTSALRRCVGKLT
jgi:hypothetical protein